VSVWSRTRNEAAGWEKHLFNELRRDHHGINMNGRCRRRGQEVNRSRCRMRMRALHVDHTLIFGRFEFRKVCVHQRSAMCINVHMEEWRIKRRKYQRSNCAQGGYSSHGRNCVTAADKVNAAEAVHFIEQKFRDT
jgi:hypothetical protein